MAGRGAGRRRQEGEAAVLGNATTNQMREARCEVKVDKRWRHGKGRNNQLNKGGGMMNGGPRRWAEARRKGEAAADSRGEIVGLYPGAWRTL